MRDAGGWVGAQSVYEMLMIAVGIRLDVRERNSVSDWCFEGQAQPLGVRRAVPFNLVVAEAPPMAVPADNRPRRWSPADT